MRKDFRRKILPRQAHLPGVQVLLLRFKPVYLIGEEGGFTADLWELNLGIYTFDPELPFVFHSRLYILPGAAIFLCIVGASQCRRFIKCRRSDVQPEVPLQDF